MSPRVTSISNVKSAEVKFPDGATRTTWSGGVGDDGHYLLEGTETWRFPNGQKQYECAYHWGRRIGTETLWRPDGSIAWQRTHAENGDLVWLQFWPNGQKKSEWSWPASFDATLSGVSRREV